MQDDSPQRTGEKPAEGEGLVLLNVDSTLLRLGNSDLTDSVNGLQPALTDIATIATKTIVSDPQTTAAFQRSDG